MAGRSTPILVNFPENKSNSSVYDAGRMMIRILCKYDKVTLRKENYQPASQEHRLQNPKLNVCIRSSYTWRGWCAHRWDLPRIQGVASPQKISPYNWPYLKKEEKDQPGQIRGGKLSTRLTESLWKVVIRGNCLTWERVSKTNLQQADTDWWALQTLPMSSETRQDNTVTTSTQHELDVYFQQGK